MNNAELLKQADTALNNADKAIRKFTEASSKHNVSRSRVDEDRNKLAGKVYEARKDLDDILSKSISAIKELMCADAQDDNIVVTNEMIGAGMSVVMTVKPDISEDEAGAICVGVFMVMTSLMDGHSNSFSGDEAGEVYSIGRLTLN